MQESTVLRTDFKLRRRQDVLIKYILQQHFPTKVI